MGKRIDSPAKIIYNENTSRQYQDQLRYKALGLCVKCQKTQSKSSKIYCDTHLEYSREYQRTKYKRKKRYYNAKSYKGDGNGELISNKNR